MGARTGLIRYNVKNRDRRYRGQDRNMDTVALARLLNGGDVQERVKKGDVVGYYGHWPRVKFGLDVQEAAIVGGRVVNLEPATRTVSIKGFDNGDVEHEIEFLDTAPGRLAERVWRAKAGGFSSAINAPKRGSQLVPDGFYGFDLVLEPNYSTNRGYDRVLDSVGQAFDPEELNEDEALVLDEVAQYTGLMVATTAMLDRVQVDYDRQSEVLLAIEEENVTYQSELAKTRALLDSARAELQQLQAAPPPPAAPAPAQESAPTRAEVLDSARAAGIPVSRTRFHDADSFKGAVLLQPVDESKVEKPQAYATDDYLARRGWGG